MELAHIECTARRGLVDSDLIAFPQASRACAVRLDFLVSAVIGKILLAAISYSQHYGLVRVDGAPVAARHAWDCYRPISDALLYNLPRHADHHLHGGKIYCELGTTSEAPELPYGYHTMALIALVPPLWNRIMGPLLADWDRRLANEGGATSPV